MDLVSRKSALHGSVAIPPSKSHTIRAVALSALADGVSTVTNPLDSEDARAAVNAYRLLGAQIEEEADALRITGTGGDFRAQADTIDVGNSGTTLRMALGSAALMRQGEVTFTGDEQIQRRPCQPLADALNDLGARVRSVRGNGSAPFTVRGLLRGGKTTIECVTSQYLSSLLVNTPLAEHDTEITVPLLNEKPYVAITLWWLERQGVRVNYEDYSFFHVPGGQRYQPVNGPIPGDFSSGTFFLAAGALPGNEVHATGLDVSDTQGDKAVLDYLREMGAKISVTDDGIRVSAAALRGAELDLNATPDALPMMAVMGCFASGTTRLVNVPQARVKETDRIAVMRMELEKLGAKITELEDGLVIEGGKLHSGTVDGHGDHRVVMALAIAGTQIDGGVTVRGAQAMAVTYPTFRADLERLGGDVETLNPVPARS